MAQVLWPGRLRFGKRPDLSIGKVNKFLFDYLCNIPGLHLSRNYDIVYTRDEERRKPT